LVQVLVGLKFVSKLSVVFFGVVLLTMASFYMGLFLAPKGGRPEELTGLSWSTFKSNWGPGYEKGVNFPVALSVFFPCYTGILRWEELL
jgi:potassium/chloride transporter 4/5/6